MTKKVAKLTSDIVNPFTVSPVMIILLSLRATPDISGAFRWATLALAFSVLPVLAIILLLVRHRKLEGIFIRARQQRHKIYLPAGFCIAISVGILSFFGAPSVLIAAFIAALLAMVGYMCINLWWKISVHTGFVAASVTLIIILFGTAGLIAVILLPVVGWSRVALGHHSPAQVVAGAVLAPLTVLLVFSFFGLVG